MKAVFNEPIIARKTLIVTGESTLTGNVSMAGSATLAGDLNVTGNLSQSGSGTRTITFTGASGGASTIVADSLTTGIAQSISSSATAITTTGRLLKVDHTGASSTSGVLSEFASAAADETVIVKITASAALALGKCLVVSGAAITTGFAVDIPDLDLLTTGTGVRIASNAPDTGTRVLLQVTNDNTAATGCTPLSIQNDATAGAHIKLTGTGVLGIDFTALTAGDCIFNCTAGQGCTAAPQTNPAIGFINIKVGGTDQWIPYYNAT